jgi:hypothetical protein
MALGKIEVLMAECNKGRGRVAGSRGWTSIRILFIFDPRRQAILLLGGDKAGNWKSWYDTNIPIAERRHNNWLRTER